MCPQVMSAETPQPGARTTTDLWLGVVLFGLTALAFLPVTRWLFTTTVENEQLLHSLLVLVFAGAALIQEHRLKLSPTLQMTRLTFGLLAGSFVLVGLIYVTDIVILVMPAYALALASAAIFVFGNKVSRFVLACMGAFIAYTGLALTLPFFDWPLRGLAGKYSAMGLNLLGGDVQLALAQQAGVPKLLMFHGGETFHVAAECNGFGLITASLLLATLLVLYKKIPLLDKLILIILSVFSGLAFNALRIVVIVLLAPSVGDHYYVMHEAVGLVCFYGGLLFLWWLITGYGKKGKAVEKMQHAES